MSRTDLVIFDCDGVLLDSEVISADMLIEALVPFGIQIDRAFVATYFLGRSYPTVFSEIRSRFGLVLPATFEALYREKLLARFERDLKPIAGAEEVARALNVPFCVATSSSPERARRSLEIAGLSALFGPLVYTASQVKNGKPAPDLPLFAAAQYGANPARCLIIEDSLNGVRAGRAAGMEVARFIGASHFSAPPDKEPDDALPDWRFDRFADFFTLRPDLKRETGSAGAKT